ncbi:MBOAT family O-acyltransferase [Desnuesiella massiliensis]|uniref:MBOAT family O-acyltransferase n=1 Tax=Desnuesiella massiliensis TaxID=1650662 RepID=UPI0018A88301|nr:MBOAT family O-acyltransferase [Desnuesiella massiliensis]
MIIITSLIVYLMGILIETLKNKKVSSIFLFMFLSGLILSLIYFKYYNFIRLNTKAFLTLPEKSIIAPIGISFYTLQAISYLVDIYKGRLRAEKNPIIFFNYICFFGTILSGPIERAEKFIPQVRNLKPFSLEGSFEALGIILWGLFKKVVIADRLGRYVDVIYGNPYGYSSLPVFLAFLLYALQLYADFSGYSSMALGFSKILGIDIINNFNFPYFSKSVREFWKRWHISLSSFFRDYVYIPLGGNRGGELKKYRNNLIVFLLSGIWHGANWTFIFWGVLHGLYIITENILDKAFNYSKKISSLIRIIITYILVNFAWVFFRADSIRQGLHLIKASTWREPNTITSILSIININQFILVLVLIFLMFLYEYLLFKEYDVKIPAIRVFAYIIMLTGIVLLGEASQSQFIYFKF